MIAAFSLAVLHYLALEFFLYWRHLWLDLPMHTLGGSVVALGYWSWRDFFPSLSVRWFSLANTLIFVLIIALVWEVFEAVAGISVPNADFIIDTISDLCFGLFGGLAGYIVGKRITDLNNDSQA